MCYECLVALVSTVCILCCRTLIMQAGVAIVCVGQLSACGKHVVASGGACLAADCVKGLSKCSSLHKCKESVVMSQFGGVAHGHKQCSVGDLSTAYCSSLYCGVQGKSGMGMYSQFEKERDQGNFDLLPELHSVLSGMKVCSPLIIECSLLYHQSCQFQTLQDFCLLCYVGLLTYVKSYPMLQFDKNSLCLKKHCLIK